MLQAILPILGAAAAGFAGSAAARGSDKVFGVPNPPDKSGAEMGQDYSGFMDKAYPGTSPWERLGANSPMGAMNSANTAYKSAVDTQAREIRSREKIASETNRAHIIGSTAPMGPEALKHGLGALGGLTGSGYDSHIKQQRERLPSEIESMKGRAKQEGVKGDIATGIRDTFAGTGIGASQLADNVGRWNNRAARFLGKPIESLGSYAGKTYADLENFTHNRFSRPRRFSKSSV